MADRDESEEGAISMSSRLFWLLVLGIVVVLVGIVVLAAASFVSGGSSSTGIVVFIGPFPIVFGSGPNGTLLIIIGLILAVLTVAFFVVMNKRRDLF